MKGHAGATHGALDASDVAATEGPPEVNPIFAWSSDRGDVYPYPYKALAEVVCHDPVDGKKLLVFELNAGQMLEDVRLAVRDSVPITFYGKTGGVVPLPEDLLEVMQQI